MVSSLVASFGWDKAANLIASSALTGSLASCATATGHCDMVSNAAAMAAGRVARRIGKLIMKYLFLFVKWQLLWSPETLKHRRSLWAAYDDGVTIALQLRFKINAKAGIFNI